MESVSTDAQQSEYLFLFRGTDWEKGLPPKEIQRVAGQFLVWFERLKQQGRAGSGQPLEHEGKVVSVKNGRTVADGPVAESKETIAGYFLMQVADEAEAVTIAKQSARRWSTA